MIRLTALLVVFNLAGLPAANAVCLAWCGLRPATTAHCHDEESPAIARHDGACAVLKERPYVREEPQPSVGIACGLSSTAPLSWAQPAPAVIGTCCGPANWTPSPPLVLRI